MEINRETAVNTSTLAAVLGITTRRIRQLVHAGVITASKRDQYPLRASVQSYTEFRVCKKDKPSSTYAEDLVYTTRARSMLVLPGRLPLDLIHLKVRP